MASVNPAKGAGLHSAKRREGCANAQPLNLKPVAVWVGKTASMRTRLPMAPLHEVWGSAWLDVVNDGHREDPPSR